MAQFEFLNKPAPKRSDDHSDKTRMDDPASQTDGRTSKQSP